VPLALVPVARLISAGRQLANAAEVTPMGHAFERRRFTASDLPKCGAREEN